LAFARLVFPNVPFNWEFYEFVGNDDKSFVGCKNQKFLSWDCLLWLGWDFGHIVRKENILTMGIWQSISVGEIWPLSMKGEKLFCACPRRGRW
jgi:hypothetical protein